MAPRKNLRSSSSKHRRRSSSPLHHTDNRDDLQQTASAAGARAPQLLQRLPLEATEAAENRPPPAGLPGRVIPDSQESLSSLELSVNEAEDDLEYEQPAAELGDQQLDIATGDAEKTEEDLEGQQLLAEVGDSQDSFNTVDTVLVPARSKLAPTHYTLRKPGINCKGRLAIEHPYFDKDMDEEATQPSTQPRIDPRRHGSSSMVSLKDEADVVCILHPTTPAAYRAGELIAKCCPQHILQNKGLSRNFDDEYIGEAPVTTKDRHQDPYETQVGEDSLEMEVPASSSRDIALRFSSTVHDPCLGWSFGRNPNKCDLPIVGANDTTMKISNMHFRIYLNGVGVLMLEDTSTNGTWVDKHHLQTKSMPPGQRPRRTIQAGSIIEVVLGRSDLSMGFLVSVPPRNRAEAKYNQRLSDYMDHVKQLEHQAQLAAQVPANGNLMAPPPVLAFGHVHRAASLAAHKVVNTHSSYNHGMAWNGGEIYNVVGHIGKGAFADVFKLATRQDGELFAAKEIEKRRFVKDGIVSHKAHNEIDVMKKLSHPNIIDYIGYQETSKHLYIIMEYILYGDLTQYINGATVLPEYRCRNVAHQMMSALGYLHKQKITHRDIKPDNILVASNEPFVVKLTDFGLSKVIQDESTFLKTFCGTLLYCAPEVYPGYEKVKAGLPQKRRRDPDEKKLPYKQSVDTWAFAAVLYHLMCGKPPFMGIVEDRGATMLETIMHNDVDFNRLTRAGVSDEGVDFVRKMLVREPSQRPTDAQCLRHPWIAGLSSAAELDGETDALHEDLPAIEEEDHELDASQLSLHDPFEQAKFDDDYSHEALEADELEQLGRSKRTRTDSPRAMGFHPEDPSSPGDSFNTIPMMLVPAANRQEVRHITDRAPPRLFGEVGTSALRSSGLLGQDIHAAIGMATEGSHDGSVVVSDTDTSAMDYSTDSWFTNDENAQHSLHYPQVLPGPAPSLLGTEALVDELNMASPESGPSGPSADSKPATPRTPRSRELSPSASAVAGSKRSSQETHAIPEHTTSKRAKSHHSTTSPQPRRQSKDASSAHQASQASNPDTTSRHSHQAQATGSKPESHTTAGAQEPTEHKGQQTGDGGKDTTKKTASSKTTASSSTTTKPAQTETPIPGSHAPTQPPSHSSSSTNSASTSTIPDTGPAATAGSFPRPAPILGRLNTVPGSVIETTHFNLTTRLTYYGRYLEKAVPNLSYSPPFTSYVYPHNLDNRVPKNALDVVFWRPRIEDDEKHGRDWIAKDDFWAVLMTRTSSCVWVNGVRLVRGKGETKFGKLYTGDVITVFGPKDGGAAAPSPAPGTQVGGGGRAAEYLKFECEFFAGLSKGRRPEGHKFTVETEKQRYRENEAKRSREVSMAASISSAASSTDNGGTGTGASSPAAAAAGEADAK